LPKGFHKICHYRNLVTLPHLLQTANLRRLRVHETSKDRAGRLQSTECHDSGLLARQHAPSSVDHAREFYLAVPPAPFDELDDERLLIVSLGDGGRWVYESVSQEDYWRDRDTEAGKALVAFVVPDRSADGYRAGLGTGDELAEEPHRDKSPEPAPLRAKSSHIVHEHVDRRRAGSDVIWLALMDREMATHVAVKNSHEVLVAQPRPVDSVRPAHPLMSSTSSS
jgi:hypothetical protein